MSEGIFVTRDGSFVTLDKSTRKAWINIYPDQTKDYLWHSKEEALIAAGRLCVCTLSIEYDFTSYGEQQ